MKKRIITNFKSCLLAGIFLLVGAVNAIAGITVTLTSPQTAYVIGSNTFTFNVSYTNTQTEWIDRFQFVFPAGITINSGTPASGPGGCGDDDGVQGISGSIISWSTAGVPATGPFVSPANCGTWFPGAHVFTVTFNVPANFTGPLTVTLNSTGDGWNQPNGVGTPDQDALTFAAPAVDPGNGGGNPCALVCPSDITVNLAPGACEAIVNYIVSTTGDCGGGPGPLTDEFSGAWDASAFANYELNAPAPPAGGYLVNPDMFDFTGLPSSFSFEGLSDNNFGCSFNFVGTNYLYTGVGFVAPTDGTFSVDWDYATTDDDAFWDPLYVTLGDLVVGGFLNTTEQLTTDGTTAPQSGTYTVDLVAGDRIGFGIYAVPFFGAIGCQASVEFSNFTFQEPPIPPAAPVHISGPLSGDALGYEDSPYTVVYELQEADGTVLGDCSFQINVLEYPNPITSLICNDLVNISLDESCSLTIGADQILEGGPYGCYDDYIVEVDRTLPLGNGPWVPAVLGPGDVHHVYAVRVTDDANGNNVADANEVKCWGNINVEDKLPPVLDCPCPADAPLFVTFSGGLNIDDPQFTRPNANGTTCAAGTALTFYNAYTFEVSSPGVYTFENNSGFDTYGLLYDGPFNPASPCTNFVEGDDDDGPGLDFRIQRQLDAGTYTLVVTTFSTGAIIPAYVVTTNVPSECTFYCADKDGILNGSIATPAPVAIDGCEGPVVPTKKDIYIDNGPCEVSYIQRTWTAKDSWGNSSTCVQVFSLLPYTLDNVTFPEDITIDCAGCGQTASTSPCVTGVPTVPGNDQDGSYGIITYNGQCQVQSEGLCNLGAQKEDTRIQVCPGTFKILRHWTVLDWCTNTVSEHDQLIKVVDNEGPAIATPGDMTVSTNPSQCCATVNLPDVIVEDACSATASISAMVVVYDQYLPDQIIGTYNINGNTLSTFPGNNFWDCDTLGRYGITPCLPIGHHQVMYMAEDVCGNTNQISFWLTVVDDVAPVATCTQFTTVAIGVDDPTDCYEPTEDCQFGGVTWVPATAFDQGSHDNCSPIDFTIRRMPEADGTYSDCIDGLAPLCDGYEYNVATTENDSIKFYCCEVGTTQTVILRVYQLDINGNRDYYRNPDGTALTDPDGNIQYIYNECMINVEVQDKIKPTCQAPAPVTINCENFEPSLWAYGYPSSVDNCCLDQTPPTSADPQGQVGIPAGTTAIPGVCGMTQKTYYSGFLGANFDTTCNRGTIVRRFTAWDCQGFSSSCTQRIVVTNTQDYDIVFPADKLVNCVTAPDFGKPVITNDEGCELIGTSYNDVVFTIVPDACYKIERTWTIINWCSYIPDNPCTVATRNPVNQTTGLAPSKSYHVNSEVNCVTYKQIIKVIDQTPPTVTCQDIDTCDYSTNNPRYWNHGDNWWDNGTMQHDLCEKSTNIAVTAEDFCDTLSPTGGLRFRYLLFLDLDGDQIMETVVSSADALTRPIAAVLYGNYNTALYHGGVQWLFDNTSTANQKYRFDIEQTANGARVIWRNAAGSVIDPELAHGRHKIKWIAEDGCGNEAVCEKTFEIRDCKPPVVACANVNINLMVGGMATLWASDFFLYGDDNCTPDPILEQKLAVIRADENPGNQFPTDLPQSIVVTCADQGTLVPVQVWLQDAAGNADFCIAYVDVQANIVGCPNGTSATVAGALATGTQGVEQATVEVTGTPNVNLTQTTGDNGAFSFNNVPLGASVVVTPTKDDNPLNGVTTYDLVLVSKHILGLEPLNTPYKMIAADANRSGSITTFDIVEFRKLILGIYNELPNNTSWRFVDKSHVFPNPSNPFQGSIPENISIASLSADMMANNFEAVKIGDVNGSAIANSLQSAEERTASTMLFDVEDRAVKAGETFTVNFKGAEKVQGYQFTMNFNGLEVMDIAGNGDIKAENFGVFQDALTTSVDGSDNEFAVTFRASKAGQLSSMLGVSSRITKAEAYSLANNRMDVAFRFNGQNGATISGVGFELYQNQPNPFVNKTFIGFHLPEAADATLRIFDETGRMVFTQSGSFAKGYNTISVDRQLMNTTGVLYYTLETATDSATKKMIQSK